MKTRARSGMTLLELVVGVVITGLTAAAGAAAFGSIVDRRQTVVSATIEVERAAALREMLRGWIAAGTVQVQVRGGLRGRVGARAGVRAIAMRVDAENALTSAVTTGDELRFTTSALTPAVAPNASVRLYVDGDANTPEEGLTIEYQVTPQAPLQRRELDRSITQMTVEYLDQTTNRWVPETEAAAVRRIAVRLTFASEQVAMHPLLQMPLVFTLPGAGMQPADADADAMGDGQEAIAR